MAFNLPDIRKIRETTDTRQLLKNPFLSAEDISIILCISKTESYKIVHKLNEELKRKGYYVYDRRVSTKFFIDRCNIEIAE